MSQQLDPLWLAAHLPPKMMLFDPPAKVVEPALRDMTPAQIYAKHGEEVAHYIMELRGNAHIWRSLFNQRAAEPQGASRDE